MYGPHGLSVSEAFSGSAHSARSYLNGCAVHYVVFCTRQIHRDITLHLPKADIAAYHSEKKKVHPPLTVFVAF